jgi:hypothetical protein
MKSFLLICVFLFSNVFSEPFLTEKDMKITSYNKKKQHRKAPKKVYIRSFKALFEVFEEAEASTRGKRNERANRTTFTSGTTTRMGVQISGVDVEDFQKVIDDAYKSFVEQLKAQGFEIMTVDEASKIDLYEDYTRVQGGASSDAQASGFVMVTPQGFEYMVKRISKSGKEKGTFMDLGPKISKELGDVYVADAIFIFPFVELAAKSSSLANMSSVKAKIGLEMESFMNANIANEQNSLKSLASGFTSPGTADLLSSQIRFVSGGDFANNPFFDAKVELKRAVGFDGVFKDKKIKEVTSAQIDVLEKTSYNRLIMVSGDEKTVASHFAECDQEAYVTAASGAIKDMMAAGIINFEEMANDK